MNLYQGEPEYSDKYLNTLDEIVTGLRAIPGDQIVVIGIDGRSGGGKTTLARALAEALDAAMLSTDDFAWWHSLFDWPSMLIENAIAPLKRGESVDYKPEAWIERDREGSITARASRFVVVEGVGATQAAMRDALDLAIWVQTDADVAKERGLIRDLVERPDPIEAERFWNEWQAAEDEFQAAQASWLVADYRVRGF